jgi:hypothetical protein
MLGKPLRRAEFSNSVRSSAVNRTLVISLRGEDAFGRKEASQFVVLQRAK